MKRERSESPSLAVPDSMSDIKEKLVDPGQAFGFAVEKVNPMQPSFDLAVNVHEAIVNGNPADDMFIVIMCDMSGSMMPSNGTTKPRDSEVPSGAKALGMLLKKLPLLLEEKIPAHQRVNCKVAIAFFASTAGWAGYDVRTVRGQGSMADWETEPTDANENAKPYWTIENRRGTSQACLEEFTTIGTEAFTAMCAKASDAMLDLTSPGTTNFEAALTFAHQVLDMAIWGRHLDFCKTKRMSEKDLERQLAHSLARVTGHIIIATDGQPNGGMSYPKGLNELHERLNHRKMHVSKTIGSGTIGSSSHKSLNFVLLGDDTNALFTQEFGGPTSIIGYCSDSTDEQLERGFMGTFGALFDNHGPLIVEVVCDFRSRAEANGVNDTSSELCKITFNTDHFNECQYVCLGLLRGINYMATWAHTIPEWQVVNEDTGKTWRDQLTADEVWEDAILQVKCNVILRDGCSIELGKKSIGVMKHGSLPYWGTETKLKRCYNYNRSMQGFDVPIRPDRSLKRPDAVYKYVDSSLQAFHETAMRIADCGSLEESERVATAMRDASNAIGLSRVSLRMDAHRVRTREASQLSPMRDASAPHYCAAMLSQAPSSCCYDF